MVKVNHLIDIFSEQYEKISAKCMENFHTLSLVYCVNSLRTLIPSDELIVDISSRDTLSIYIYDSEEEDDDIAISYYSSQNNWEEFCTDYANLNNNNKKRLIKIEVSKKVGLDCHSIYNYDLFCTFLKDSQPFALIGQLADFSKNGIYVFEWNDNSIPTFVTSKFHFRGKGKIVSSEVSIKSEDERGRCISKASYLCSSTGFRGSLLPEDLFPINSEDSFLKRIFNKLSMLYALCFILDYTQIEKNELKYKLNGFKSIVGTFDLSQSIEESTQKIIQKIYLWGYQGGDIDDKILIIRNILSLNIDANTLNVHSNTFDAIISNYKIYQKENVRQYLDLRNNIVRDIKRYQDSIISAIDNFEDTFKKMSISLLSFFFISVVLSILSFALSSNRHIPDAVILCCIALCLISLWYHKKERKWLNGRIAYLESRFKNSKKYYEDLLGKKELKNFFDEENNSDNKDEQFRTSKIDEFSNLWKCSTGIILVVLLLVLILNHIHPLIQIVQMLGQLIDVLRNLSSSIAK